MWDSQTLDALNHEVLECGDAKVAYRRLQDKSAADATYVSVWDGGIEIRSRCKFNPQTKIVSHIEPSEVEGVEILENEYVELADGSRLTEENGVTFDY